MELRWRLEDADELWIFASELQGPVALAIAKLDDTERQRVRAAIEERAAEFATGDGRAPRAVHQRCRPRMGAVN